MGYELGARTQIGVLLSSSQREELREQLSEETTLDCLCEIVEMGGGPYISELKDLEEYFDSGEFDRQEYQEFCTTNNLPYATGGHKENKSARMFIDSKWGQHVFFLKMPRSDEETREAYRMIVEFSRRHSLVVDDPQAGRDIDLENPGEFPPWWSPQYKGLFRPILDWFSKHGW